MFGRIAAMRLRQVVDEVSGDGERFECEAKQSKHSNECDGMNVDGHASVELKTNASSKWC